MMSNDRRAVSFFCGLLSFLLLLSIGSFPLSASSDISSGGISTDGGANNAQDTDNPVRIHAAYSFDGASLTEDVGGKYPLSDEEFGSSLVKAVEGRQGKGMKGYITLDHSLFKSLNQFSMGFWTKFSLAEARKRSAPLIEISGAANEKIKLAFTYQEEAVLLELWISDAQRTSVCTYDLTGVLNDASGWNHFAFSYKKSGNASLITLYVNGKTSASSLTSDFVDLSLLSCESAFFYDLYLDEVYFTNVALDSGAISSMMSLFSAKFYESQEKELSGDSGEDIPSEEILPPAHAYNWAAYLFDGTFAAGADYHSGDIPAVVDPSCIRIDSSKLISKYGYAIIRREGTAPVAYLDLDSRLFDGQPAFSFTCWIYRDGKSKPNDECLLDLNGKGTLRFAPYSTEADATPSAYVEYTDSRGKIQHKTIKNGNPSDPYSKWVHYGLTVSSSGDITVYINGVYTETFSSGVNPAALALDNCRMITGASTSDPTRTAVDEVYIAPKALSAVDIRKIHAYGLERFTSQVLPDPLQSGGGKEEDPLNPYTPDSVDMAEDAYNQSGVISDGFIGTTFDDRNDPGLDWNRGANATITAGRLTQGVASYGLSLDGTSSFVRYPSGILDGVEALTISLSYCWEGTTSASSRSQRLFDFSRKASSVADPAAYLFLETGTGLSGLRFGMSDGTTEMYLTCDYNVVNTWTRVTVTISQGVVTLYINDAVAATGYTDVSLSSICPNYCYIGRSGVKGDPLFKGTVDEVYLSANVLPPDRVGDFIGGLSAALNGTVTKKTDVWSIVVTVILISAVVLVGAIVTVIVIIIVRKEKPPAEEPPVPISPAADSVSSINALGPRSARRVRLEAGEGCEDSGSTVKFRKVGGEPVPGDDINVQATAKFRKVSDDAGQPPEIG